jgi:phage tail protein X
VSAKFPNGIANSSGLVGKNLMFHPYALTYGYVDEPLDGNHGPPLCLWSQEFYETDPGRDFVRGYTFQFGRGVGSILEAIVSSNAGTAALGRGPSRRLSETGQPPHRAVGDLRGSTRGT